MSSLIWYPGHDLALKNIVRAENCRLYDARGRQYVDLESGVWCTSVGHGNRRVLEAMAEQARRVVHTGFSYSTGILETAAQKILSLHNFQDGKCVFLSSGSEAVEFGVRVAQSASPGTRLLTMADSYFGAYGSAAARKADQWFAFDWASCTGCGEPGPCSEQCRFWAKIPFDDIGGFVFEPGSSSGLVRFPPEKLVRCICETVQKKGGTVLANEVTTGVGRTGRWFGYQHYGLSPDIVCMGKGIGNGYPVSAAAVSSAIAARLAQAPLYYSQSHQNDPLGAAVAAEVISIIEEEKLIERGQRIGRMLSGGLEKIRKASERIGEIRSRGLMAAVEIKDDPEGSFTATVRRALLARGYVVAQRPGLNVLRLDPSLTVEEKDIDGFLGAFGEILTDGMKQ